MSVMAKAGRLSSRYFFAKVSAATEAMVEAMRDPKQKASGDLIQVFSEAYNKQLTQVIGITGSAMAPALNSDGLTNPSAFEKLVVRLIPRPSGRTLAVGDVVAFNSPLNNHDPNSLMVRRVAALEGHPMLTTDDDSVERVPLGHCWVLADNEQLQPPDVIDSRAFGFLDMRLIIGRVIYRVRNSKQHGPVANSPQSEAADAAVIEGEVDVDELAAGMPAE